MQVSNLEYQHIVDNGEHTPASLFQTALTKISIPLIATFKVKNLLLKFKE